MVRVVVIGFGYGGLYASEALENAGVDVVVVERNECFFHKIGGARACIEPGYEAKAIIPLDKALKRPGSRLVHGMAKAINEGSVHVELRSGDVEEIEFDALIIATGLVHGFGQMPNAVLSEEEMKAFCRQEQAKVAQATSVQIVGGGALGAEASAQIRETHPDKTVKLFHSKDKLLSNAQPPLSDQFSKTLAQKLEKNFGVELNLGAGRLPEKATKDGELEIWATGCKPVDTTTSLFGEWMDKETGELRVNDKMEVIGAPANVYAIGDVAGTKDYKQARWAYRHALVAVHNIVKKADEAPHTYKEWNTNPWKYRVASYLLSWYIGKRVSSTAVVGLYLGSKDGITEFYGILWNDKFARKYLPSDKGASQIRLQVQGPPPAQPDAMSEVASAQA